MSCSLLGRAFLTICYSADGKCLLAAGQSKSVCIYSVPDQLLIKKFDVSCNMSFDGMEASCSTCIFALDFEIQEF